MSMSALGCEQIVRLALAEDIGSGDITTASTVPMNISARAVLLAKSPLVLCGLEIARHVFEIVDASVEYQARATDGDRFSGSGEVVAEVTGPACSILTGERVALNFLQRLTGVATITDSYVKAVQGTQARIVDTRKTTPGLRVLEKYAVRVGGGRNHRFGLADGVLIKDNHIAAAGGIGAAVRGAKCMAPHTLRIEVEVKQLSQIEEAIDAGADVVLLDNMPLDVLREAAALVAGRVLTEASGGVNLATVREIAETGVDLISVGALTHSAPAADISLDIVTETL